MKCPWCNAELDEDTVLCTTCGNEINMVPDFDPEIEDQCRETIETMTKDIFSAKVGGDIQSKKMRPSNSVETEFVSEPDTSQYKQNIEEYVEADKTEINKKNTRRFVLFIGIFVALLIAAVAIVVIVTSDSYKLSQAQKAANSGEYEKAYSLYHLLLEKDPDNIDLLLEYSYVLNAMNAGQEYEEVLYRIAENPDADEIQTETAYERLIYIYSGEKEYNKIRELIISVNNETILDKYSDYLTKEPEIVLSGGTYELPQMVSIMSGYDIYYTLINEYNGETTVIAENELYRLPILLEMGSYKLSAYTTNKYGLASDVVEVEYDIELVPPIEPEINIPEGTYGSPQLLEVYYDSDNIVVYYTTDGTEPGLDSKIYNGSMVIPYGRTKYSFVSVDDHGLKSNVVTVTIEMQYEYTVQPGTARDMLISYLLEKGTIVSYDGTMPDGGCLILEIRGFEPIGENYCYVFEEAMEVDGIMSYLDVRYSVDMITGEIAKMEY
ncbi:MAG: chitobiase/beta-hexosaminidase C-terminal domain-containing protein [Lachnospiraceae bacterium]|nr:chitobiase/beta-hexosaminidase C-terminal domain-containing protein [Lachnospiraceae bacterium]